MLVSAALAALLSGCGASAVERGSVAQALAVAPGDAFEASFTDWSRVNEGDLASAVREGLRDDSLTRSTIAPQSLVWEQVFGFSPQSLDWELTARSASGAILAFGWSSALSDDEVQAGLEQAGYERDGDRWELGADTALPASLSGVMAVVELDPGRRMLVAADTPEAFTEGSLLDRRGVAEVAGSLEGTPRSALFQDGPATCASGGVSGRGTQVEEQGTEAARRAGRLKEPVWSVRAVDGERFFVAAAFDSPATATDQARVRERLATGPFIGRAGLVEDVLRLTRVATRESVAMLAFTRESTGPSMMSTTGPLLLAGC
ncbi:hypothetical protein D9V41_13860 [Aeromicrobium phragmitis]|uniref:Uncharacterized protein n=2 Tax=Aeromicrobium phragmitis TaxID=2478914 RepID=A0A3L8PIF2_9ACTN|nr:hypothetical protein D9V41_13860 [Aeromicrobium phragmitis]